MSERTYVVGLPVIITVDDEGHVMYEIDTCEAGTAVCEDQDGDGDWQLTSQDVAAIETDHAQRMAVIAANHAKLQESV